MIKSHLLFFLLLITFVSALRIGVQAAPSDLDPTFGVGGIRLASLNSNNAAIEQLFVLPDGKLIAIGNVRITDRDFVVARFNVDGSLDQAFGTAGMSVIPLLGDDPVRTGIVQPDGKIIIAGTSGGYFAMARVTKEGQLDTGFGSNGIVTTNVGSSLVSPVITGIGLQPDGRIVAGGNCHNVEICVARYMSDGSLDSTFGTGGIASIRHTTQMNEAHGLVLQGDGKILIAGWVATSLGKDALLIRYNPDGTLDSTFDGDGVRTHRTNGINDNIAGVVLRPDGKIITFGSSVTGQPENIARISLMAFNPDGSSDTSFGDNGISFSQNPMTGGVGGAVFQPDGKLVVAAAHRPNWQSITAMQVARFNVNGLPDLYFGNGGSRMVTMRTQATGNSVAVQSDGKIVVGGFGVAEAGGGTDLALARFNGGNSTMPAAANITGQVLLNGGVRFKGSVRLELTGPNLPYPLYAQTNPFGFFHFAGVPTGSAYEIRPSSKTYRFYEPVQNVLLYDTVSDVYILVFKPQ